MASSKYRSTVAEDLVRAELFRKFGERFSKAGVRLRDGGMFEFDAVSDGGAIIGGISTNVGTIVRNGGRKKAWPKLHKIRSDIMFLLRTNAKRKFVALTDKDMYDMCQQENLNGRMPREVEFYWIELPAEAKRRLLEEHRGSVNEMSNFRRRSKPR